MNPEALLLTSSSGNFKSHASVQEHLKDNANKWIQDTWPCWVKDCYCPSAGACGIDHSWTTISCLVVQYQCLSLLPFKNGQAGCSNLSCVPLGTGPHGVIVYIPCGQPILSLSRVLNFHCWHCTSDLLRSTSFTSAVMLKYVTQFKKWVYMNLSNWFNCTLLKLTKFDPVASDPGVPLRFWLKQGKEKRLPARKKRLPARGKDSWQGFNKSA